MWTKFKNFIRKNWLALIVFFTLIGATYHEVRRARAHEKQVVEALTSELETYKLKNGELVTSVKVAEVDKSILKSELEKSKSSKQIVEKFSKPKTLTKIVTITKFDTIREKYTDTIPAKFEKVGIAVRKNISYKYYITQNGITLSNIQVPDTTTIVTGTKKKWFFGDETLTMDIHHSNPYVEDQGAKQFTIKNKRRWYESPLFLIIGGMFIGGAIAR